MLSRVSRPFLGIALGGALLAGVALSATAAVATTSAAAPDAGAGLRPIARQVAEPAPFGIEQVLGHVPDLAIEPGAHGGHGARAGSFDAAPGTLGASAAGDEPDPTPTATPEPTATEPTADPTATTTEPTTEPTAEPTTEPTTEPTATATATAEPTATATATATPTATTPAPTPSATPSTPPVDKTAPTGTFVVSATGLWVGQTVTLKQTALADDVTEAGQIRRVVNWGDGSAPATLAPGATQATRSYAKAGKYTVTVTLTDAAGNPAKAKIDKPTITITVPGAFKLSKKAVWPGEKFKVTISKVPGGTKAIDIDWGDGWVDTLKGKNQSFDTFYWLTSKDQPVKPGTYTIRAKFTNGNGTSAAVLVGKISVRKDSQKPKVGFTKPSRSKANKVSSWKTLRGTASDKGSGLRTVWVYPYRFTATAEYCYTAKKTWRKIRSEADIDKYCGVRVKVSKGKWSLKLSGMRKGYHAFVLLGVDWTEKVGRAEVAPRLTRN